MRLIDGKAMRIFRVLYDNRGWWDGNILANAVGSQCMSTYKSTTDKWLAQPDCKFHHYRIETRRNPQYRKYWQYRLAKREGVTR